MFAGRVALALGPWPLPHLLGEPHLDQRLVRDVALVGSDLDVLQQADGKAQRNRRRARLKIGQADSLGSTPVEGRSRILALPISPLVRFASELRHRLTRFLHM